MKLENILIAIAIVLIACVSAISAHKQSLAEKDAIIEMQQQAAKSAERALNGVRAQLVPKPYCLPVENLYISSATGYRVDPMGGSDFERLHKGVDLSAAEGTPVRAALAGVVEEHWLPPDDGLWKGHPVLGGMITIQHDEGFYSIYGHLSATYIHEGEWVEMGQIIGEVGNTGMSTANHLHFEIVVDPLRYLGVQ